MNMDSDLWQKEDNINNNNNNNNNNTNLDKK